MPAKIQVTYVYMPVFVGFFWLFEACAFLAGQVVLAIQPPSSFEDSIRGTGADSHNVFVEHHECQSSIAFQGMLVVVVDNGFLFPFFDPPIARYLAVVFIRLAVAMLPAVILAAGQS